MEVWSLGGEEEGPTGRARATLGRRPSGPLSYIGYNCPIMMASEAIRNARIRAGITQTELARRLGTTQSAVARLEAPDSNPTVATLERALTATGHRLLLAAARAEPGVDE